MKVIINRSEVLSMAHRLKVAKGLTFGEAQKQAWKIVKAQTIKDLMKSALVTFYFLKENGEVRKATGTINGGVFSYQAKGGKVEVLALSHTSAVKYWDIDANGFRSFRVDRLLKIEAVEMVTAYRMAA